MKVSLKKLSVLVTVMHLCIATKAQIVYTDINPDSVITPAQGYDLDLNNDGISDFHFYSNSVGSQGTCRTINFGVSALNTDSIIIAAFVVNEKIGDTTVWSLANSLNNIKKCSCSRNPDAGNYIIHCGKIGGSNDWYLPLKIVVKYLVYYGWVRLSESASGLSLTIKDYAYNSIPGQPILAGEGANGGPLPLTVLSFVGSVKNNKVQLTWVTSNEINSKGFEVEKSDDGKAFYAIGFINSNGNALSTNHYSFIDNNLISGYNFYRLKQTDPDGKFTYSKVVQINYSKYNDITVSPNPVSSSTNISFTLAQSQKVFARVFDGAGRLVKTLINEQMPAGVHQITWNARNENGSAVANGMYYLKFIAGSYSETKKLSVISNSN